MSISQNFPNTRPSLNLNFARSKTLDPRITFTRPQTGNGVTYVGEDGLIKYVSADEPRFDHDPETGECLGLLIEESRTNLITYSEDFQDTSWSKFSISITGTSSVSPAGSANATEFTPSSANSRVYVDLTTSADGDHTFSVFAKAGTGRYVTLRSPGYGTDTTIGFDLVDGIAESGGIIINFGNGWYRCSMTFDTDGDQVGQPSIYLATTFGGYSGDVGETFYLWGAQLEAGAFPTSYIPTSGGTATRNPDNVTMTGDNFSDWYNQSEGTVYSNTFSPVDSISGIFNHDYTLHDGSSSEVIRLVSSASYGSSGHNITIADNSSTQFNVSPIGSKSIFNKVALAYKENDSAVSANVGLATTDTCTIPTPNILSLGGSHAVGNTRSTYIRQFIYYPVRLPNSTLQTLTK